MTATVNWISSATAVAAIATLVLAVATWRLVGFTKEEAEAVRRQAEATERQAELTARALASSTRPWLTAPTELFPIDMQSVAPVALLDGAERLNQVGIEGHVAIRNAGQGLAVMPKDSSFVWGRGGEDGVFNLSRNVFPRSSILAPAESTLLEFFVSGVPFETFVGSRFGFDFVVHVLFTDADGGQPVVASFRVTADPKRPPSVFEISYRHLSLVPSPQEAGILDDTEPFAVVRPGLPG